MPNCVDYDCGELTDHLPNSCNTQVLGGSDAIAFLTCDHQLTDPSDSVELQAEYDAGRLKVFKSVKVGIPAASPVTTTSYIAGAVAPVSNYDRTITVVDANYNQDNITLYDLILNNKSFGGALVRLADSDQIIWLNYRLTAEGSPIVPDDTNEAIRFETTFKGRSKLMGNLYANSSSLFD